VLSAALVVGGLLAGGCDVKSFIDPSEMGRYQNTPLQKPILTSLSSIDRSIDDPEAQFVNATDVTPEDLEVVAKDYVIGKNDLVNVSVTDLVGPGVETTKTTRVSESGNISLPLIGQVHAEGLTEAQLEQAIIDAYRNANLIQSAQVSVTVAEARARTFSALGAVGAPGQYAILQSDFRMLDALVLTRDVQQSVDTVYVIRQISEDPENQIKAPATPAPGTSGSQPGDNLSPHSQANPAEGSANHVALLQTSGDLAPATRATTGPAAGNAPAETAPVQPGGNPATANQPFQFAAPTPPVATRVIRVPLDALRNGDLRYNIVIRPHDLIIAPNPVVGEYYMGGHVARVGVYSLSARHITLKQAVISAGMLDGAAIPQRTDLIRRIGTDREVFARINLDAIFSGTEPDIYLKPNDQLMVGTNFLAPFIAAVRGGFRLTYGFGFLYDRNYAPQQAIQ
jgi:polysaccharide export outer membrane protein